MEEQKMDYSNFVRVSRCWEAMNQDGTPQLFNGKQMYYVTSIGLRPDGSDSDFKITESYAKPFEAGIYSTKNVVKKGYTKTGKERFFRYARLNERIASVIPPSKSKD